MRCGKCKGEVRIGEASCRHCGVKFAAKPKPAAPPPKSDQEAMWGAEDAPVAAPPPRPPPRARPINTGRPATDISSPFRLIGGGLLTFVVLAGIGIKACIRFGNATPDWQTVEDRDCSVATFEVGAVKSDIRGEYVFTVRCINGPVKFGVSKIAGEKPTFEEITAMIAAGTPVAAGKTEAVAGSVIEGRYLWYISNQGEKPAQVHILFKGRER